MKAEFTAIIDEANKTRTPSPASRLFLETGGTIPRHAEVKEPLARKILRNLGA